MDANFEAFSNWKDFSGKADRSEYNWFMVPYNVVSLFTYYAVEIQKKEGLLVTLLALVVTVLIIPCISVTVRRLHDLGVSGWWFLAFVGIQFFVSEKMAVVISCAFCFLLGIIPAKIHAK